MLLTLNGIEKVRGSTPLISTTSIVCFSKGFRTSVRVVARLDEGEGGCFTTLYNTDDREMLAVAAEAARRSVRPSIAAVAIAGVTVSWLRLTPAGMLRRWVKDT